MKKLLNSFKTKAFRVGGYSVVAAVIVLAIIIIANVVINSLPSNIKMIDLSQNLLYSFSDQTKKIVSSADRQVNIYYICQAGYENTTLTNMLDRYNELSDNVHVIPIDTNSNPTFSATYGLSEVKNNSLLIASDLRYRYIDSDEIFKSQAMYNSQGEYIGTTASLDGEQQITSAVNYCLMQVLPKVYSLTGHGESDLPEEYQDAVSKLNLEVQELSLLTVSKIPDDCDTVMLLDPLSDINEAEYNMLNTFLDTGGRLLAVTSPTNYARPWLDKLMAGFSMKSSHGIVVEGDASNYAAAYDGTYLLPNIENHAITQPLIDNRYSIFMPLSSGITWIKSTDNVKTFSLLRTTLGSYEKEEAYNYSTLEKEAKDPTGPFTLAMLSIKTSPDYSCDDSMVVWFSSSSIMSSTVNQLVSGANMDLLLNSLSYICDQTNSISIHSKSMNYRYLNVSGSAATLWSVILIGILPAACLATGLVIFLRRRKR